MVQPCPYRRVSLLLVGCGNKRRSHVGRHVLLVQVDGPSSAFQYIWGSFFPYTRPYAFPDRQALADRAVNGSSTELLSRTRSWNPMYLLSGLKVGFTYRSNCDVDNRLCSILPTIQIRAHARDKRCRNEYLFSCILSISNTRKRNNNASCIQVERRIRVSVNPHRNYFYHI
jgi:hypothetical protein